LRDAAANEFFEPRLDDGTAARIYRRHLARVCVDADDLMTAGGQGRRGYAPDVAKSKH
jgi:hypothetical protein